MKKFESVQLGDLHKGDRFYFADDKDKRVWETEDSGMTRVGVKLVGGGRAMRRNPEKRVIFLTSWAERNSS